MVESLKHIVHELAKWGNDRIDMFQENEFWLERELVQLYKLYFDISEKGFSGERVENLPQVHYGNLRINLAYNFPSFGFYPVANLHSTALGQPEWDTVDALDQLADVLAELKIVDSLYRQGREEDALHYFTFAFQNRIRTRLLSLLHYLKTQAPVMAAAV